ncbi:DegV family protein [Sciscionella sediminilitoris]|uniref:DegV family protein n=1 Tax=Sciscionella sediminilitoris TaxID=1445613 RepID=UPI0004DFC1A7|nr:DegV family protein [Sciscionella sp. SE31]
MTIRVVTDSTAYLPEGFADRHRVDVVPLHVLVDGRSFTDGAELGPAELVQALRGHAMVSTSRPNPEDLAERYRALLADGASEVVSVHLSRELSGTWEAACRAAERVGNVRVVDSRSTAMGLGFAVLAAARAAGEGQTGERVEAAAVETAERTATWFCVPTMEYLRRGGRIGTAAALLGTALAVKPVLHIEDGRITGVEKVRTMSRAKARLIDLASTAAGTGRARLAVHHLGAKDQATLLAEELAARLPAAAGVLVSEVGAVIGAHTGPGVLGVVVLPESVESH